jgi:hypothetical protein
LLGGCVAYPYGYGYNGYYGGYYAAPAYPYPSGNYLAFGFGDGGWNEHHWHHWHDHDGHWWR